MAAKRKTDQKFDFTKRAVTGKGVCRKLRSKNALPVVLYGPNYKEGLAGTVDAKAISVIANSPFHETTVVTLNIESGASCQALIRDIQRHPLTQQLRHIDFYEVVAGHKIKVEIPIHLLNKETSQGIKDGGVLNQPLRAVTIEVEPAGIPEEIEVDLKELGMGAEIFVKDLAIPEGAAFVTNENAVVLNITQPKSTVEEEPAEEAEGAKEPEVVAKGKKEEE